MENSKLVSKSFLHALGVLVYVSAVATIMFNAEHWFGPKPDSILVPMSFLLLFVLSAAVVGLLIFAKPVMMYLDGQKKEAVSLTICTVAWLAIFTLIVIVTTISVT